MNAQDNTLRDTTTAPPPFVTTTGLVQVVGGREGWRLPNWGAGVNPNERTCPCKTAAPTLPSYPDTINPVPFTPGGGMCAINYGNEGSLRG